MPFFRSNKAVNQRRTTIFQLRGELNAPAGCPAALLSFMELILPFIAKQLYIKEPTPAEIRAGYSLPRNDRGCRCESIYIGEVNCWSLRFSHPSADRAFEWFYDLSVIEECGHLLLGVRIETSYGVEPDTLQKSIPLLDLLLSSQMVVVAGRLLNDNLRLVTFPEDVPALVDLITSPTRAMPVLVISAVNRTQWSFTPHAPDYLIDSEYVAEKVRGFAIVVKLGFRAAYELTARLGKPWAVFDGACRIFLPGIDLKNGNPVFHHLKQKGDIWYWKFNGESGPQVFTSFVISNVIYRNASSHINWHGLPFVSDARLLAAEINLVRAGNAANAPEREKAMQEKIAALQEKMSQIEEENNLWAEELDRLHDAVEFYQKENAVLRSQLEMTKLHLSRAKTADNAAEPIPIPETYRGIGEWVQKYLAGSLLLLPRAERACEKADYTDAAMVYRALLILGHEYRDTRTGAGSEETLQNALKEYGMTLSGSIDPCRAGEEGEDYFVNYPLGSSRRVFLKYHLEQGNSRESRFCLRVYFFWDSATQQVVVGWLPSHLGNRIS